ncbi:malate/lactate/ureidoglycolate dehydrogenase [Klebsiella quasipneumoniae]
MPTGHRFLATDLHQFVVSLFTHLGSRSEEATLVADHLIAANLAGHDSHGVGMIPSYVKSHAGGFLQLNRHATVTKDAGAVVTLDGNAGFGQVVAHEAMQLGIEKAKQHGMAAIALRNAHHVGRIGYWAEQCAAAGLISIHFVSVIGDPMVAPFRGKDSRFGTNPLCVVFPREGHPPLLLDYATSAIAFGKTRVAWHKGEAVAPGCLIDAEGLSTTDPAVMQTSPLGALLTFAQHKGYALATLCEVLGGALSGGQTTHQESLQTSVDAIFNCMTTVILRPDAFDAPDSQAQTEAFIAWCKQSPHDPDAPVLAPGEWEAANREARLAEGIPLDTGSWQAICAAARDVGLSESHITRCRPLA